MKSCAVHSAFSLPCWSTHFTPSLNSNFHVRPPSSVPHFSAIPGTSCPLASVSRRPSLVLHKTFRSLAISVPRMNTFSISLLPVSQVTRSLISSVDAESPPLPPSSLLPPSLLPPPQAVVVKASAKDSATASHFALFFILRALLYFAKIKKPVSCKLASLH